MVFVEVFASSPLLGAVTPLEEALTLPDDQRRHLAERLLESVPGADADVRKAWVTEATRRADEAERGEGELLDLARALGELRAELKRPREV